MRFTYTIIEPDTSAILYLKSNLDQFEEFECLAMINEVELAEHVILKHVPDVVLLNIDEEHTPPFEMVEGLHQYLDTLPRVVALSKDTSKAINAIKSGFFDYWVMPSNELEIQKTIFKLKRVHKREKPVTICLKSYKDYRYLNTEEILYLKADNNTTDFFMKDGNRVSAYKTLKYFEERLPNNFIRVHQSYVINTEYISRINYGKSICMLTNGSHGLPFSKSYRSKIDEMIRRRSKNSVVNNL